MYGRPNVLLLSSEADERDSWESVLGERVALKSVGNLLELQSTLAEARYAAFFCSWSFQEGDWTLALTKAKQLVPDLPVIIFCRTGGEMEWIRVLEAGAFDLLAHPYQQNAVLAVLEHAVASHEARRIRSLAPDRMALQNIHSMTFQRKCHCILGVHDNSTLRRRSAMIQPQDQLFEELLRAPLNEEAFDRLLQVLDQQRSTLWSHQETPLSILAK